MIEQFNRILQKFGGHRVRIKNIAIYHITFELLPFGIFRVNCDGDFIEITTDNWHVITAKSEWLKTVSLGMVRNDAGELQKQCTT